MSKIQKNPLIVILLVLMLSILLMGGSLLGLQTYRGYLTGTQGLEPQFHSVYWYNSWWSTTEKSAELINGNPPSSLSFGYSMDLDPDAATNGMSDFCASQQPITLQTDVEPKSYIWNYKVESGKTLENGTIVDVYKQFEMFRYKCDWAANVWLSGTADEAEGKTGPFKGPFYGSDYSGAKLWIKLVPRPFIYFQENPDQLFFAPAYIGLAQDVTWAGVNKDGTVIQNDPDMLRTQDIIPKAGGETVGIYYERGGGEVAMTEDKLLSYQGTLLDPQIFRDEYWMRFDLTEFKPLSWYDLGLFHNWKFPSAYMKFTVYLFAVGQWTVYIKTGEVPPLNPHTPIVNITDIWANLFAWLTNPWTLFWLFGLGSLLILVLLIIFAPSVLTIIAAWIFGRRKGEG